jgi:hypothetical protein
MTVKALLVWGDREEFFSFHTFITPFLYDSKKQRASR